MLSSFRLALLLPLAIFLAACGPLPRPFKAEAPESNPLLKLASTQLILVEAPSLTPELQSNERSRWPQQTIAEALQREDVPATIATNAKDPAPHERWHLETRLSLDTESDGERLRLHGTVRDTNRRALFSFEEETRVAADSLTTQPEPILAALSTRLASRAQEEIAKFDSATKGAATDKPTAAWHTVLLEPLPEALGNAASPLADALRNALTERRITLVTAPAAADSRLSLRLQRELRDGQAFLTMTWVLRDNQSLEELGTVEQANTIPDKPLEKVLRPAADPIAQGTALGIGNLLRQKSLLP